MTSETTILSEHIARAEGGHYVFQGPKYPKRFRQILGNSSWNERILFYEEWLNRGCIGAIIIAVLYFFPMAITVLMK
jgi:hypothetical protein